MGGRERWIFERGLSNFYVRPTCLYVNVKQLYLRLGPFETAQSPVDND